MSKGKHSKRIIMDPLALRFPIVPEMCEQCEKQYRRSERLIKGTVVPADTVCESYENPGDLQRRGGCYLKTDKKFVETAKEKMKRKFGLKRRNRS